MQRTEKVLQRQCGWLALYCLLLGCCWSAAEAADAVAGDAVLFNRDIRPILSDTCFPCHGFDANKRQAGLRLDTAEGLVAIHNGRQAVKARDRAGSELWRRVSTTDPKLMMPPPTSGKKLKPEQIELLGTWIDQGGAYQTHWAFVAPTRPTPPQVEPAAWPRNDIDRFILATLKTKSLSPAREASKETLVRRVTLDLTGLPPSLEEVDAFLTDKRADAYDRLVDRLLESPRYGEQMAHYWLDVARYGDTHGLHLDNERSLWPYRDWVVGAFNQNLPFDQFTVWQLAGDLLPNPTREQLIASGYNRCNVSTSEGGAIDEEFQVRYAVDRTETVATTWMGLTMGCAVCHDHKLDPIYQKEFYQMFSIFNNIAEKAMDGNALLPPPSLPLPSPEQEAKLKEYDTQIAKLDKEENEVVAAMQYDDPATQTNREQPKPQEVVWVEDDFPAGANPLINPGNSPYQWVTRAEGPVFSGERALRHSDKGLHQVFFSQSDSPLVIGQSATLFAYVYLDPKDPPKSVMLQYYTDEWRTRAVWGDADLIPYGQKGTTEKEVMGAVPEPGKWVRLEVEAAKLGLAPGTVVKGMAFTFYDGTVYCDKAGQNSINDPAADRLRSFSVWTHSERELGDKSSAPAEIKSLLKKKAHLAQDDYQKLLHYYLLEVYGEPSPKLLSLRQEIKATQEKREALEKQIPATMISRELEKPRPAWVLIRGQYDKHGEPVGPGVPSILPPLPASPVTNRLTFARWLVAPNHPLTARVTVNRFWQQFFGTGIVKTTEDFGTKGEWPSHPELLDWLATTFVDSGWDIKHLVRLIVTSSTYRQDSAVLPELVQLDPENRWLARGPRYRLDAEELRDNALYLAGLLNLQMGGRGVHPYQPPGIWEAVGYTTSNTAKYSQDHGESLFRRSLYIFWKRTAAPPVMTTLDAPSREQCRARRERTDTPLQALLLMNDTQYFEAARHLGYRMIKEGGSSEEARLSYGFRLAAARPPTPEESSVLEETLAAERARYTEKVEDAQKVISVGESPVPADVPPTEMAAYTMVANLLLNLDEVITKN